ncbi:TPA_asm: L [Conopholis alphacytorhabdovirus 1]|nr:TPA_asm: L [Conopholis alphacytorhabdovirus 1]
MSYLEAMDEERKIQKRFDPLPDFHLQNPLYSISSHLQMWENKKSQRNKNSRKMPVRMYKSFLALSKVSNQLLEGSPTLLKVCIEQRVGLINHIVPYDSLAAVQNRLKWDVLSDNGVNCEGFLVSWIESTKRFPKTHWNLMREGQELLSCLNALSSRRPLPSKLEEIDDNLYARSLGDIILYITPSYLGIDIQSRVYIIDSDWLRSVCDIWTERFLLCLSSNIGNTLNQDHYPSWSLIKWILQWGDNIISQFGNDGYKLLKTYEALVLGVLQEKGEGTFVSPGRFLMNTLTDLSIENISYGRHGETLVTKLRNVESPHHLIQLYGLHRIWGHPLVNPGKGMEKMLIIGQKDIVEDSRLPEKLGNHFKKMFCKSYRDRTGLYPEVQDKTSTLGGMLSAQTDWNKCNSPNMEEEWVSLRFSKCFEIPESFNLSMIVADKSVSPTMSELKANILERGSVMNAELRRGVLKWINNDTIDPKPFLIDVSMGKFPQDHKIIGLRSKEREMNPTPRMFALMSHLMRVYVVITESMLSEHILPHFPQITMTDDLLSLTKKTYTTVKQQSGKKPSRGQVATKTVCMSLDFEKWNGHMRQESTLWVFKALGDLFGMEDLYHVTYDIFKESFFYLADGSYVPKISDDGDFMPEPPLSFTGHKGGQEGLRQKGWTIFTVVGLDLICSQHNCSYKIMGMGDNQVLQLTFFTHKVSSLGVPTLDGLQEMRAELDGVFSDLLETFNSLGLPLKPLETWISEDLFVYGKYPVWKGVPLTMDLKKIMRIFPFSNQELMTTENILNTIAGNAQAATQAAPHLGVSYIIGLFMLYLAADDLLDYHPLIGKGLISSLSDKTWKIKVGKSKPTEISLDASDISRELIRELMVLVPRVLGGYVSFSLYGLMMRGFPDPLSLALSQLYTYDCHISSDDNLKICLNRWMTPIYMPDISYRLLTEDVSSVNLFAPVTPTAGLRREVEKYLSEGRSIKNPEFKELMGVRSSEEEETLAEHLCTEDTLHIRLIHDILESTIFGYVKSIVSKVTNSSTILSLAVDKSRTDPLSRVIDGECNYFKFFLWRSKQNSRLKLPNCPTTLAKEMRRNGWKKNLIGVTVAFPLSYLRKTDCFTNDLNCTCIDGCISLFTNDTHEKPENWNRTIGGNPPYLGSMTKEKLIIASGTKIYSGEPLIRRPINLMRVIGWFVPDDSRTAEVIRSCVSAVSDLNPDEFRGITEGTSGSEIHRYKDTSLKHGALCSSNYLYSTRYHVSTDTFTRYAKGAQNFDMMFQANLCAIVEIMHLDLLASFHNSDPIRKVYHHRQTCYECISPLDEQFHDIGSDRVKRIIPSKKSNKHLFVAKDKVSMTIPTKSFMTWVDSDLDTRGFARMPMSFRIDLFHEILVDNISMDVMNSGEDPTYLTTSLLDIKEHNRLFYLTATPKTVFDDLCSRIYMMAEWRCLTTSDWRIPTPESLERAAVSIITSCRSSNLAGMAGFFTWKESMDYYYCYPEIVEPDTIPVTVDSACKAIKTSLINLLSSRRSFSSSRQTHMLIEETKSSKLVLKMMIYDHLKKSTNRWCCLRAVAKISPHELSMSEPASIICSESHPVFPGGFPPLISRAQISIDALKKSIDTTHIRRTTTSNKIQKLPWLSRNTIDIPLDTNRIRAQLRQDQPRFIEDHTEAIPLLGVDLMKVFSLPTNAKYKYFDLLSAFKSLIAPRESCFLLGNGLGGTSDILNSIWGGRITLSTLLDTSNAIPQSYPHADVPFKFSRPANVDSTSMININNDILSDSWVIGWEKTLQPNCDFCLSDIEVSSKTDIELRNQIALQMLNLRPWKLLIIKDYIYSKSELCERLSIILQYSSKVRLATSSLRQRVMPECWWVIENVKKEKHLHQLYFSRSVFDQIWVDLKNMINSENCQSRRVLKEINGHLNSQSNWYEMLGKVRAWATLPIVGSALPLKGNFTRLFGYLQKGKKPREVQLELEDSAKKLYQEDFDKLRTILIGLAAAMIGPIELREQFVNETEFWNLTWRPNSWGKWEPFLKKERRPGYPVHVYDMIPMLSVIMFREKLVFKGLSKSIRFMHNNKRTKVCFPITKAASLRDK